MSDSPSQPGWSYANPLGSPVQPPEGTNPGTIPPPFYPGYQPPEGTNPGTIPPPAGAPGMAGRPPYTPYYAAYPGPMAPATSPWAIASLICSIAGFLPILPLVGAILGVIFGHVALNEIKRSNGAVEGHGMAVAGLIIGYTVLGLLALGALCVGAIIVAGLASGAVTQ